MDDINDCIQSCNMCVVHYMEYTVQCTVYTVNYTIMVVKTCMSPICIPYINVE